MNQEIITVYIPTYNREKQLKNTLKKLERQTNDNFNVVISDNCSDYDVYTVLDDISEDLKKRCTIKRRENNMGANMNYMLGFIDCKTKWIWNIGDDDLIYDNSIEIINKSINKVPDAACINFSLMDDMPFNDDGFLFCESLLDFTKIYNESWEKKYSRWHGDLIFISNKVFNNYIVKSYIHFVLTYLYAPIPVIFFILKILENNQKYICCREKIVNHQYDYNATSKWVYRVVLSTRVLSDLKLNCDESVRRDVLGICSYGIRTLYYLYFCVREDSYMNNNKYYLDTMYHSIYKFILPLNNRIEMLIILSLCKSDIGYKLVRFVMLFRFSKYWARIKRMIKNVLSHLKKD